MFKGCFGCCHNYLLRKKVVCLKHEENAHCTKRGVETQTVCLPSSLAETHHTKIFFLFVTNDFANLFDSSPIA